MQKSWIGRLAGRLEGSQQNRWSLYEARAPLRSRLQFLFFSVVRDMFQLMRRMLSSLVDIELDAGLMPRFLSASVS